MHIEQPRQPQPIPLAPAPCAHPDWLNVKASAQALRATQARQVSGRRRGVDPTTSDRDYSSDELEFMQAMQAYKHSSGRMFPTWSEVLEVLRGLGYDKDANSDPAGPGESGGPTAA